MNVAWVRTDDAPWLRPVHEATQRSVTVRFVLHNSVALAWSLQGPLFRQANDFLYGELVARNFAVAIVEGTVFEVLAGIVQTLGEHNAVHADAPTMVPDWLINETLVTILLHFPTFEQLGVYHVVRQNEILRGGYFAAVKYNLPLFDALTVRAADSEGVPLLVVDDATRARFQSVPRLRVYTLADYHRALN